MPKKRVPVPVPDQPVSLRKAPKVKPRRVQGYTRNKTDLTRIKDLVALGHTWDDIEKTLGVSQVTIRTHYWRDIAELNIPSTHRHQPDEDSRKKVVTMASYGMNKPDISRILCMDRADFDRYYLAEYETGRARISLHVGANIFKMATGPASEPNTARMAALVAKSLMGWREASIHEITGPDGEPLKPGGGVTLTILLPDNGRGGKNEDG